MTIISTFVALRSTLTPSGAEGLGGEGLRVAMPYCILTADWGPGPR